MKRAALLMFALLGLAIFPLLAGEMDADGDGLSEPMEAALGTDPGCADTDGDGCTDGVEVEEGTDPLDDLDHPDECGDELIG